MIDSARRLHTDAVRLVKDWASPSAEAEVIRQRFVHLLDAQPGAARADNPGAHLTASTLIVSADRGSVLLCLHRRVGRWVQTGGHCEEHDSSLADAALREATEESGIDGILVHPVPIDLDIHTVACRYGASSHYDVRFAALAPPDAVERVSEESHAVKWFPADHLPEPLATATARLVAPALAALGQDPGHR